MRALTGWETMREVVRGSSEAKRRGEEKRRIKEVKKRGFLYCTDDTCSLTASRRMLGFQCSQSQSSELFP